MYSTMGGSWCMVLTIIAFFCQCSTGFVVPNPGQSQARLTTRAGRCDIMRAAAAARQNGQPASWTSASTSRDIEGGCGWRTSAGLRSRQRRRRGSSGVQHNGVGGGGVGSLRAGMEMPGLEVVEYLGKTLIEQSVRHHYPSAFIGGTVGVLGTLTAIKIKINQVKELTACPYCRSTGQLPCATCFGVGSVTIPDTVASSGEVTTTTLTCPTCRGKGFITCVNCKGDGRGVPLFLNKKVSRDPESEIEDVGYA